MKEIIFSLSALIVFIAGCLGYTLLDYKYQFNNFRAIILACILFLIYAFLVGFVGRCMDIVFVV